MMINGGLIEIRGGKAASVREVLERALVECEECDGVVVLMQPTEGSMKWYAPDNMRLETAVFYCWSAMCWLMK